MWCLWRRWREVWWWWWPPPPWCPPPLPCLLWPPRPGWTAGPFPPSPSVPPPLAAILLLIKCRFETSFLSTRRLVSSESVAVFICARFYSDNYIRIKRLITKLILTSCGLRLLRYLLPFESQHIFKLRLFQLRLGIVTFLTDYLIIKSEDN